MVNPTDIAAAGKSAAQGTAAKISNRVFTPLGVFMAVDDGVKAYDALYDTQGNKQMASVHATNATLGAATSTAGIVSMTATGTVATAAGVAVLPLTAAAMVIGYMGPRTTTAHYFDVNSVYNPSQSKRYMIGLGSGRLHDQLVDPSTGRIDWTDQKMLEKYTALLTKRIDDLEVGKGINESILPDGIRIFYLRQGQAVDEQNDRLDELALARTALIEVNQQMQDVWQLKELQKEIQTAQSKLTGGTYRELTLPDLDRDGDGVLSKKDKDAIVRDSQNQKYADMLFAQLENLPGKQKVTFENQSVEELEKELKGNMPAVEAPKVLDTQPPIPERKPRVKTSAETIISTIGGVFTGIFDMIKSVLGAFMGSSAHKDNVAAADKEIKTNHPRITGKDPMEEVVVPAVGIANNNNASLKR